MIGRTVKSEGKSAFALRHAVRDHSVTRGPANAFADAIGHSHDKHLRPARDKRKERPRDSGERITEEDRQLACAETVAQVAGKEF